MSRELEVKREAHPLVKADQTLRPYQCRADLSAAKQTLERLVDWVLRRLIMGINLVVALASLGIV
jgi:hypothetical protein